MPVTQVRSNVGVVSFVALSLVEEPVSEAAWRSGVPVAAVAVVSIVTLSDPEAALALPEVSVWIAVIERAPSLRAAEVNVTEPAAQVPAVPVATASA